ncbi:hypothetical protein Tco_0270603 [Tanacetum coccineum]
MAATPVFTQRKESSSKYLRIKERELELEERKRQEQEELERLRIAQRDKELDLQQKLFEFQQQQKFEEDIKYYNDDHDYLNGRANYGFVLTMKIIKEGILYFAGWSRNKLTIGKTHNHVGFCVVWLVVWVDGGLVMVVVGEWDLCGVLGGGGAGVGLWVLSGGVVGLGIRWMLGWFGGAVGISVEGLASLALGCFTAWGVAGVGLGWWGCGVGRGPVLCGRCKMRKRTLRDSRLMMNIRRIGSMNGTEIYHGLMRNHELTLEFGQNPHKLSIIVSPSIIKLDVRNGQHVVGRMMDTVMEETYPELT